jgi:hypothetical protein
MSSLFWAHLAKGQTGLSAPIFFAPRRQKSISASIPCALAAGSFVTKLEILPTIMGLSQSLSGFWKRLSILA